MNHRSPKKRCFTSDVAKILTAIPRSKVEEALIETDNLDKRKRKLTKADMAYFVTFMAFCPGKPYQEVYRILGESENLRSGKLRAVDTPATSSIVGARQRLGVESMKRLSKGVLGRLGDRSTKGAYFKKWSITAIDGMVLNVPDTPANAEYFPRSRSQYGEGAYPQIRCVALVECGTRSVIEYALTTKKLQSEHALAVEMLSKIEKDQLLLADRLYCDGKKWRLATQRGGKAIFRARADMNLPVLKKLKDGSYLSELVEGDRRRKDHKLHPVRVVEFRVKRRQQVQHYRVVTNLDKLDATPKQIIDLYKQRWEWETVGRELKHVLNGNPVLRSNTPDLVKQEIMGMLMAHHTVKIYMHAAALREQIDMDRLSFKHSFSVMNRKLRLVGAFSP